MLILLLIGGTFVAFASAFGIAFLALTRRQQKQAALTALRDHLPDAISDGPALLRETPRTWSARISLRLQQADSRLSPARFITLTIILGVAGAVVGASTGNPQFIVLFGLAGAYVPTFRLNAAIRNRSRKLEEQFPDALDFLSRAMRAGHAFSVSLEMLADETPEPTGSEFRKLYHEQNLGAPLDVALHAMADRCRLMDVQFFVSAVLLQRETGGNLTEILTRLAHTIRERLRLKGQVRAASAHGRITGLILTVMPIVLMGGFMVISPNYLNGLAADEHGRMLIAGAIVGQVLGYLSIRKITNIQV